MVGNQIRSILLFSVAVVLGAARENLTAQTQLEITLKRFNADEVKGYVQPIGDLFGANMNAGLYHSAKITDDGFHMRIDLIGMASFINESQRTYDATLPAGFVPEGGSYKTATVFGADGTTFKDVNSGLEYKGSDGLFHTNIFPMFVPQVTFGSFFGTEVLVRYLSTPALGGGKFPSSSLFGVGGRHSVSQHFGADFPIDIAVGGFYSNVSVGDLMDFNGTSANVQMSKSFSFVTLYTGAAWETSITDIHYTANAASTPTLVSVTLDGGNMFRFTTGLEIDLQAIRVYADANFGYVRHFSGGIGFGF